MGNLRLGMAKETQLKSWELGLKLKLSLKSKSVSICPSFHSYMAFPGGTSGKEPACQCRRHKRRGFDPWVGTIPWRRKWQPTPVFLPGEFHGQRSLSGYCPWGRRVGHSWETNTFPLHFQSDLINRTKSLWACMKYEFISIIINVKPHPMYILYFEILV